MMEEDLLVEKAYTTPTRANSVPLHLTSAWIIAQEFVEDENYSTLPWRLTRLCERLQQWIQHPSDGDDISQYGFTRDPVVARRDALTAAVLKASDGSLMTQFESIFRASLTHFERNFQAMEEEDQNELLEENQSLADAFADGKNAVFFRNLRHLAWIGGTGRALLHQTVMDVVQTTLYNKVELMITGNFESCILYNDVLEWNNKVMFPWLGDLLLGTGESSNQITEDDIINALTDMASEAFCTARMKEIFELVTSYPDSEPAVLELCNILTVTDMYHATGQYLRDSLIRRLNHPGADTSQIIDVYISTIKVLRLIDPTDRLLEVVAEPVRSYLRGRSDTVRCIITSLTDAEAGGDLYQELRRQDVKLLENVTVDSDDEEEPPTMKWQPLPSINKPKGSFLQSTKDSSDSDILAMLVSIYGSKELFVNEYRLMLADKLLANLDYDTDKERHTLLLLKLRFGDVSMNSAEIMIKDIDDSVRTNKNIHDKLMISPSMLKSPRLPGEKPIVDACMISHIFWPKMQNEPLKHHPRMQVELDDFSRVYAEQKNPRKLNWMNQLGTVVLELNVTEADANGQPQVETKEITCSPLLATLISHFEDRPSWTVSELSNETGLPDHAIRKRMAFWVTQRVVMFGNSNDEYTLSSQAQRQAHGGGSSHLHDEEDHMGVTAVSAAAQHEEEMVIYESYIVVMLTNLPHGSSLDKIHNMLKMMLSSSGSEDSRYNKTPQQLSTFLQKLCRQEKLECGPDGTYKLMKK